MYFDLKVLMTAGMSEKSRLQLRQMIKEATNNSSIMNGRSMNDSEYRPSETDVKSAAEAHNAKVKADYAELENFWNSIDTPTETASSNGASATPSTAESTESPAVDIESLSTPPESTLASNGTAMPEATVQSAAVTSPVETSTPTPHVIEPELTEAIVAPSTDGATEAAPAATPKKEGGFWNRLFGSKSKSPEEATPTPVAAEPSVAAAVEPAVSVEATSQPVVAEATPQGEPITAENVIAEDAGESPAPTAATVEAPTDTATPAPEKLDTQAILGKLTQALDSDEYDAIFASPDAKKAFLTMAATKINGAGSALDARISLTKDLLNNLGKSKKGELQGGLINQLMDATLGAESGKGAIILPDGTVVREGDSKYKGLKSQLEADLERQRNAVAKSKERLMNRFTEEIVTDGQTTIENLAADATTPTENTEAVSPIEERSATPTPPAEVTSESTAASNTIPNSETRPSENNENSSPELTEDTSPAPETVEDAENQSEQDKARMVVLTESLLAATRDEIKGMNAEQMTQFSEAINLLDKYASTENQTQELLDTIDSLSEAADLAFAHQENYLSIESDDNWDTKRSKYLELQQAYDPTLDINDPGTAADLEAKILEKFGEKPKAYQEKARRANWRRHKLGVSSERRETNIQEKRQRGPEVTEAAVRKTIEVVGKGVGEVMAVPDHARNVYDRAATGVLTQVDRVQAALDRSGNILGAVGDEATQFVIGMPEAVVIATQGMKLAVNQVADEINVKIGEEIGKGFEALKQAVINRVERMKQNAERRLEQRRLIREQIAQNIAQTTELMETRKNDSNALWGLLGGLKRLRTR